MQLDDLTPQEIERMRAILAQHDKSQKAETIDLNNPKTPPYRYQKFPTTLYHHAKRANRIVQSEEELQGFTELGWVNVPYPAETESTEPVLDAASAAEAARVDQQLAQLRKKK